MVWTITLSFKETFHRARAEAYESLRKIAPEPVRDWIKLLLSIRNRLGAWHFYRVQMQNRSTRDEYDRLLAGNVAGIVDDMLKEFHAKLGTDAAPPRKLLAAFRQRLTKGESTYNAQTKAPVLLQFEEALALCSRGRENEAFSLFESVFCNLAARRVMGYDSFAKNAVVTSGKFLARHYDQLGDVDRAIALYREIVTLDRNRPVPQRLIALLLQRGEFAETARFAGVSVLSRPVIYPSLRDNVYFVSFKP